MWAALPALLIAAVLIASGVAKLRHPDNIDAWATLGVPRALRRAWLLRFHPWGEIALGILLAVLGGVLGTAAAIAALALMLAYLVLVVRVRRTGEDAMCACFGARRHITGVTVVRNSWYVALSALAVATTGQNPVWGGPLAALDAPGWGWMLGAAAAAVTVVLTLWPEPDVSATVTPAVLVVGNEEELDYVRSRTPAVPVTGADGERVILRDLSITGPPVLLLHVRPGCGSCVGVRDRLDDIRALLPEVHVRLLLTETPEESEWTEHAEPQSLHDPEHLVRNSIGEWGTPTALLLGTDGLLAGGPVTGSADIFAFIDDVYESLHGERPATPLSTVSA